MFRKIIMSLFALFASACLYADVVDVDYGYEPIESSTYLTLGVLSLCIICLTILFLIVISVFVFRRSFNWKCTVVAFWLWKIIVFWMLVIKGPNDLSLYDFFLTFLILIEGSVFVFRQGRKWKYVVAAFWLLEAVLVAFMIFIIVFVGLNANSHSSDMIDEEVIYDETPTNLVSGNYLRFNLVSGTFEELHDVSESNWSEQDKCDNIILREITPGEFKMGEQAKPNDLICLESPIHNVKITHSFFIGVYEITRAQWQKIMKNEPWKSSGNSNLPASEISYDDCKVFLSRLSELSKDWIFRMPTEAEWEYVCQLGHLNAGQGVIEYGWYKDNSNMELHCVGERKPNKLGLYDMLGNVWEWCQDCQYAYSENDEVDPVHLSEKDNDLHVSRGGGYRNAPDKCTPFNRSFWLSEFKDSQWGLRVVAVKKDEAR